MLLIKVLHDADEQHGSTCAFAVVDALGSERWCACSIDSSSHHLHDTRCIVHVHMFSSTDVHLPTMPEWLTTLRQ